MQRLIDAARLAETLEALRDQPTEIAYTGLMGLKGVGHWTAAWTLIRAQGQYHYVGSADVALRAAVNFYYHGLSGRADRALTDQTFAQYGAFDGLAAYYTLMRWAFERYPEFYI
jgi:3-methyladenine DNA glycosylase/8-oxoguanine DNA glycosylase